MNNHIKPTPNIGPLYADLARKLSRLEPEHNKDYDQDVDPHYRMLVRASVAVWQLHSALALDADTTEYVWHSMVLDETPPHTLITTQIDAQDCIHQVITMQKQRWSDGLPLDELEEAVLRRRFGADDKNFPHTFADIQHSSEYADDLRQHGVSAQRVAAEALLFLASETLRQKHAQQMAPFQSTMSEAARRAAQLIAYSEHRAEQVEQFNQWWQEKTQLPINQQDLLRYWKEFKNQQIFNARPHLRSSRVVRIAVLGLAAGILAAKGWEQARPGQQLGIDEKTNVRSIHMLGFRAFKKFVQSREKA